MEKARESINDHGRLVLIGSVLSWLVQHLLFLVLILGPLSQATKVEGWAAVYHPLFK
jgi:hypothetical protein